MSKNIEIEKRVMLTEEQYNDLLRYALTYKSRKEMVLENHYFDDEDLSLRNAHHMLRIRSINGDEFELTLKVKGDKGDLEINEPLNKYEVDNLKRKLVIDNEEINNIIKNDTNKKIKYITSLKTKRIEIEFDNYLFVLDKNYYSDVIDYDLEIESSDLDVAEETIKKYCSEFHLQYSSSYKSKSRRAINKALNI